MLIEHGPVSGGGSTAASVFPYPAEKIGIIYHAGRFFSRTVRRDSRGNRELCVYSARYFLRSSGSDIIRRKTPPTTERAWNPTFFPSVVSYQSVSGTRVGVSLSQS